METQEFPSQCLRKKNWYQEKLRETLGKLQRNRERGKAIVKENVNVNAGAVAWNRRDFPS